MVKPLFITLLLFCLVIRASAEKALKLKFQDWNEDDDRIRVRSWYAQANTSINSTWDISVTGMVDSISGATPWGAPPTEDDWLETLKERREAGTISLSSTIDDYDFSFELGRSEESDYLSRSYAVTTSKRFAEDTLTLSSGISYLDDDVDSDVVGGPYLGILKRRTPEFFLGMQRIIDPKTTLSLNLTYGRPKGYLSDPYKQIFKSRIVVLDIDPDGKKITELRPYRNSENRPNKRKTFVAYLEGARYFENLDATLESTYRYFTDDSDLSGHTLEFQWLQRLSDRLILLPLFRYYIQNPADFYMVSLDGTEIEPVERPNGTGPHYYSSDYRLSKLRATTLGLKFIYFAKDNLSFDLSLDRYEMKGMDNQTDQRVYPSANVITVGTQWLF